MKNLLNRSIITGIVFYSFFLVIIVMAIFFTAFPFEHWMDLWDKRVFELPFILLVVVVTLLVSTIFGLINGLVWKKQINILEQVVDTLNDGPNATKEIAAPINEIVPLVQKVNEVRRYMLEQTKRTQKLIDERVKDQEEQIEKVVSEERNRLARELHDSVSQELFAASMMVSAINEMSNSDETTSKQLKQVESMIQQAQLEMRALLLHLRPIALKDKSLKEGMKQLLGELQQKVPIDVTWNIEEVTISKGIEDHLFRILQESVSNTLRHAKAHTLDILLIERDQHVILRVIDDGVGFNVDESLASSYGLSNMKERAEELGAKLRIISVPNEGTRLEVRVPIIEIEGDEA